MTRVQKFKHQLANVFDNDMRTKQWEKMLKRPEGKDFGMQDYID